MQKCFTRKEAVFRVSFFFKKKKKKGENWKSTDRKIQIKVVDRSENGSARFTDKLESEKKVIKEDRYPLNKNTSPVASSGPWRNGTRKRLFVDYAPRERKMDCELYTFRERVLLLRLKGSTQKVDASRDDSSRWKLPILSRSQQYNKSTLKISTCGHLSIAIGSTNSLAKTLLQCYSIISEMIGTAWTKNEKNHQ